MPCITLSSDADKSGFAYPYLSICSPLYSLIHGQSNVEDAERYSKFINLVLGIGEPTSFVLPNSIFTRVDVSLYKPIIGSDIYNALVDTITYKTPRGEVSVRRITDIDSYMDVVNTLERINTVLVNADSIRNASLSIYNALKGLDTDEAKRDRKIISCLTKSNWIDVFRKYKDIVRYSKGSINVASREKVSSELRELNLTQRFIEEVSRKEGRVNEVTFSELDFDKVNASIVIRDKSLIINASDSEIFDLLLGELLGTTNVTEYANLTQGIVVDVLHVAFENISRLMDREANALMVMKPENLNLINHFLNAVFRLLPCLFMERSRAVEVFNNINCEGNTQIVSTINRALELIRGGECDKAYNELKKLSMFL